MFDRLFERLIGDGIEVQRRTEGVAFLKASKELYSVSSIAYLGLNIEAPGRKGHYVQCAYSDAQVMHCVTKGKVRTDILAQEGFAQGCVDWHAGNREQPSDDGEGKVLRTHIMPLRARADETALLGIAATMTAGEWERHKKTGMRDIAVLGNYFHSHVLRINGHNSTDNMLISARELDCLKWTAAGKTAWEASVILGISERTVRFHLNAAREKLSCATTTQAVAKAIGYQLIDV